MPNEPESLSALCDRLEALAAKATPGPWHDEGVDDYDERNGAWRRINVWTQDSCVAEGEDCADGVALACAAYLAALDPETVHRLIAAARAGEALVERGKAVVLVASDTFAKYVLVSGGASEEEARAALNATLAFDEAARAWRRATGGEP